MIVTGFTTNITFFLVVVMIAVILSFFMIIDIKRDLRRIKMTNPFTGATEIKEIRIERGNREAVEEEMRQAFKELLDQIDEEE